MPEKVNPLFAFAHEENGSSKEAAFEAMKTMFLNMSVNSIEDKLRKIADIASLNSELIMNRMTAIDIYTALHYEQEVQIANTVGAIIPEPRDFYTERALSDLCECLAVLDAKKFADVTA